MWTLNKPVLLNKPEESVMGDPIKNNGIVCPPTCINWSSYPKYNGSLLFLSLFPSPSFSPPLFPCTQRFKLMRTQQGSTHQPLKERGFIRNQTLQELGAWTSRLWNTEKKITLLKPIRLWSLWGGLRKLTQRGWIHPIFSCKEYFSMCLMNG